MSRHEVEKGEQNLDFKWGNRKGVGRRNKNFQFYESFTYEGVEYSLYDSVVLYRDGDLETFIGKLVRICETPTLEKKVKILWFFRPMEVRNFLNDYKPGVNELFLASGKGVGLYNFNSVDSIIGKCNVLCASHDQRNPQISDKELRRADYIFSRTFDVAKCKIEESFPEEIDGVKVENFFNRKKYEQLTNNLNVKEDVREYTGASSSMSRRGLDAASNSGIRFSLGVQESKRAATNVDMQNYNSSYFVESRPTTSSVAKRKIGNGFSEKRDEGKVENSSTKKKDQALTCSPSSKPKMRVLMGKSNLSSNLGIEKGARVDGKGKAVVNLDKPGRFPRDYTTSRPKITFDKGDIVLGSCSQVENKAEVSHFEDIAPASAFDVPFKKRKLLGDGKASKEFDEFVQNKDTETDISTLKERLFWFKQPVTWEEKLQRADKSGMLVSLENLDPCYTSPEVEDLVRQALNEEVEAKMLQRSTFSNPNYGKALVIFKSKDRADSAISELTSRCLVIADGRPVIGCRTTLIGLERLPTRLIGHLYIGKLELKKSENMKKAVSTSHCSQANTIEYDMAIQWLLQQKQADEMWKKLYEEQEKEIQYLRSQLKLNYGDEQ